jgi:hypothetical protein
VSEIDRIIELILLKQVQVGTLSTPRFLHIGGTLINVDAIKTVRQQGAGRTLILGDFGNIVVDMDFDTVRAQLAKFGIVHELDPREEAKP